MIMQVGIVSVMIYGISGKFLKEYVVLYDVFIKIGIVSDDGWSHG